VKTATPRRDTYAASLAEVSDAERELFASVAQDFAQADPSDSFVDSAAYQDADASDAGSPASLADESLGVQADEVDAPPYESIEAPLTFGQIEAARRVVDHWASDGIVEHPQLAWSKTVQSVLLRRALGVLSAVRDTHALGATTAILVHEPHLTPNVCNYLRSVAEVERGAVVRQVGRICRRRIVSVWQAVWLSHLCGEISRSGSTRVVPAYVEWLRLQVASEHPALAAQALLALARRRSVDASRAVEMLSVIPRVHRPTVLMALAVLDPAAPSVLTGDDMLERWQAEWAVREWT